MLGFSGCNLCSRTALAAFGASIRGLYEFLFHDCGWGAFSVWKDTVYVMPDLEILLYLAGFILTGVIAYPGLMNALWTGEVCAVTPLRYSRLLFGVAFGVCLSPLGCRIFLSFTRCGIFVDRTWVLKRLKSSP